MCIRSCGLHRPCLCTGFVRKQRRKNGMENLQPKLSEAIAGRASIHARLHVRIGVAAKRTSFLRLLENTKHKDIYRHLQSFMLIHDKQGAHKQPTSCALRGRTTLCPVSFSKREYVQLSCDECKCWFNTMPSYGTRTNPSRFKVIALTTSKAVEPVHGLLLRTLQALSGD